MSTKLEKYIAAHSNEFDEEELPINGWNTIANKLTVIEKPKVKKMNWLPYSIAACFTGLLAFGFYWLPSTVTPKNATALIAADTIYKSIEIPQQVNTSTNFAVQCAATSEQINIETAQLNRLKDIQPSLHNKFKTDINVLQSKIQELQQAAQDNTNDEDLQLLILKNLELQQQLIQQQILILNKIKKYKTEKYEKELQLI